MISFDSFFQDEHLFKFGRETFHLISGGKFPPDVPQSRGDPIVLQFQHTESTSTLPHCHTLAQIPFVLEQFFGQYNRDNQKYVTTKISWLDKSM